jgi:hypothetical protein
MCVRLKTGERLGEPRFHPNLLSLIRISFIFQETELILSINIYV